VGLRLLAAAAAAVFLSACEVYAVPSPLPCPGESQGVFDFAGEQIPSPDDCFFAQPGNPADQVNPLAFQGTVSFGPGASEAALCISKPHALPRLGTHSGLAVDVAYVNLTASVGGCTCPSQEAVTAGKCLCSSPSTPLENCSCPVFIEERVQGSLIASAGGYSGFQGTQVVNVTPPDIPLPAEPCDCQVACSFSYALTAKTVGTR
jgi:hypothetical protein